MSMKAQRIGPDVDKNFHGTRLAHNAETSALSQGDVVYFTGTGTAIPEVELCDSTPSGDFMVVFDEGGIPADDEGRVCDWVLYQKLDVTSAAKGDPVYWDGTSLNLLGGGQVGIVLSITGGESSLGQCLVHPAKYLASAVSDPLETVEIFDDFLYQNGATEVDKLWILNSGSDDLAVDPSPPATQLPGGVIALVTGDGTGGNFTVAEDGSQMVLAVPVTASKGGLFCEALVQIATAVTTVSVNVGLTDSTALEEPFSIAGTTITSVASDAACFVYDTGATTDQWYACAVDSDTDDTDSALTGSVPVADTYQLLRLEVSEDGGTIKFYIDGELTNTLDAAGVTPGTSLYFTIVANSTTTTSKTVYCDAVRVGHLR